MSLKYLKNLIFFLFFIFNSFILHAQVSKNHWLVGGDAALSYSKVKLGGSETFTVDVAPNIGYFFFDKVAFGARADYILSRSKVANSGTTKFDRLLISPFARYYFSKDGEPIIFFAESSYRIALINENNSTEFSVKGGAAIFFNDYVAFEVALEYINSNTRNDYLGTNTILLGFGIQTHLIK